MEDFLNTEVDLGVKSVQLLSGESIIGRTWYNEVKKEYTIDLPVSPTLRQTREGGVNVSLGALRPWLKDIQKQVLRDTVVAYISDVSEPMARAYQEATSDIQLADASQLSQILKG